MDQLSIDYLGHKQYKDGELPPFEHIAPFPPSGVGTSDEVEFKANRYARKSIILEDDAREKRRAETKMKQEIDALKSVRHGHVISFVGTYLKEDRRRSIFAVIMEPVADMNLEQFMASRDQTESTRTQLLKSFGCLVSGLAYLHSRGIRHRGIKPQNILVRDGRVMFTDVGISTIDLAEAISSTGINGGNHLRYSAPEVVKGLPHGQSADIFSMGAVFLEMIVSYCNPTGLKKLRASLLFDGQPLYAKKSEKALKIAQRLTRGQSALTANVFNIFQEMLDENPDDRPDAASLQFCWSYRPWTAMPDFACSCSPEHDTLGRNFEDTDGALYGAASNGHTMAAKLLITQGAKVNVQTQGKGTALHAAATAGHTDIVRLLLHHGADINERDKWGATPLHCATANGKESTVRLLLDRGADLNAKDDIGKTSLVYARRNRHEACTSLLKERGAMRPKKKKKSMGATSSSSEVHAVDPEGSSCSRVAHCQLTSSRFCCACVDRRPLSSAYEMYIDGRGVVRDGKRWDHYCPSCRGHYSTHPSECIPYEGSAWNEEPRAPVPQDRDTKGKPPLIGDKKLPQCPTGEPSIEGPKSYCEHKFSIPCGLGSSPLCCSCSDQRPIADFYERYDDGKGITRSADRWQYYCPPCQRYFGTLPQDLCEHKRSIPCLSTKRRCCACSDRREIKQSYSVMRNGRLIATPNRWEDYCLSCQDHERRYAISPLIITREKCTVKQQNTPTEKIQMEKAPPQSQNDPQPWSFSRLKQGFKNWFSC